MTSSARARIVCGMVRPGFAIENVEALRKWEHAMSFKGTCLCRAVQYAVDRLDTLKHRHCRTFRKAHANAYAATAGVPREHFRWIAGEEILRLYESSPGKLPRFCSRCGMPWWTSAQPSRMSSCA